MGDLCVYRHIPAGTFRHVAPRQRVPLFRRDCRGQVNEHSCHRILFLLLFLLFLFFLLFLRRGLEGCGPISIGMPLFFAGFEGRTVACVACVASIDCVPSAVGLATDAHARLATDARPRFGQVQQPVSLQCLQVLDVLDTVDQLEHETLLDHLLDAAHQPFTLLLAPLPRLAIQRQVLGDVQKPLRIGVLGAIEEPRPALVVVHRRLTQGKPPRPLLEILDPLLLFPLHLLDTLHQALLFQYRPLVGLDHLQHALSQPLVELHRPVDVLCATRAGGVSE